jgi:hypothetical protein
MAIRYCGDVEVRVFYRQGRYHGAVRAPGFRGRGILSPSEAKVRSQNRSSPEAYDAAAQSFLRAALGVAARHRQKLSVAVRGGRLEIRRTFQCPCPVR